VLVSGAPMVRAAELQVVRTHNVGDIVITLLSPEGEWSIGENRFVLEFDSAPHKRLIDAGAPALMATLSVASVQPLRVSARLKRGDVPGRYVGAITLPRAGEWSLAVSWNGPASSGAATFPVPVTPHGKAKGERR
jgi:hypothetical protein